MTGFNMLHAGGTAQLKFSVFAGSIQLTSVDIVSSVNVEQVTCPPEPSKGKGSGGGGSGAGGGATSTTVEASGGGRFTVRWQSPDLAGTCWRVTVGTIDGSSLSANFKLR